MTSTDELRRMLDERGVEYEANRLDFDDGNFNIFTEWGDEGNYSYVEYSDGPVLRMFGCTPEQAIAATLGDDDYERKMDALLCRLTNGKWSKSRTYSLDFMESCIREEFERDYDEQICSTIGSSECEMEQIGNVLDIRKCSACGYSIVCEMLNVLRYCPHCGKAVKR